MLRFGLSLGRGELQSTPPIIVGDYIWYSFDPRDGFFTESDSRRFVNDEGNTIMVGASGAYNGLMKSGRSIALSGDGYIDVPITATSYITYFDVDQHQFVVPPLSGDTFRIESVTFNSLVVLDNKSFTQDDLDKINEEPELLVKWGLGENVLSIPKESNDKYYPCTENYEDSTCLRLNTNPVIEIGIQSLDTNDLTLTSDKSLTLTHEPNGDIKIESDGTVDGYGTVFIDLNNEVTETGGSYVVTFSKETLDAAIIRLNNLNFAGYSINGICEGDPNVFFYVEQAVDDTARLTVQLDYSDSVGTPSTTYIRNLQISKVANTLAINGTYTRNFTSSYGLQTLRLELDGASVPTKVIDTNRVKFHGKGEQIDSGVVVDGSQTDFTMMVAISSDQSGNGRWAKFVDGGGSTDTNNRMILQRNDDLNEVYLGIGDTTWIMPLDMSLSVNAFCAVYNHQTGEVLGAMNGEPLQSFGTIVFDKPHTDSIVFGGAGDDTNRTQHFMGEGISAAEMQSEAAWFDYWGRVGCPPANWELLNNFTFNCGKGAWSPTASVTSYTVSNGVASITRGGPFALIRQRVYLKPGAYTAEIEVVSTSDGNSGYLYFQDTIGGDPTYPIDPADVGVHSTELTVATAGEYWIGIGVNSPSPSTVEYGYISLRPSSVMLLNPDINGADGWQTNTDANGYTGTATFTGSTVTLVAEEDNPAYFSLIPSNQVLEPGNYSLKIIVTDISGTAKMSYKVAGSWNDVIRDITTPGIYEADFIINGGTTTDIQIGHQNASAGDSITFDYIGVTKK